MLGIRLLPLVLAFGLIIGLYSPAKAFQIGTEPSLPGWLNVDERTRLEKEHDPEDRVEALLKFSAAKLEQSRTAVSSQDYEKGMGDVRNFSDIIDYTSNFINQLQKKEKDKKKLFKRLELGLRQQMTVLEAVKFELPSGYAEELNQIFEKMRRTRESALGLLFGKEFFPTDEEKKSPQ